MTDDGQRRPWWYSGGPEGAAQGDPEPADLADVAAELEADSAPDPDPDAGSPAGAFDSGVDWSMLVAGAQRMVDWATERVMAPHAEHDDPAQYPECVVCRTLVLVGDSGRIADAGGEVDVDHVPGGPPPIVWIPIRDDGGRQPSGD